MLKTYRVSQKIAAPRLCGYCGGAAYSIILFYSQLHRSGFNTEFETFLSQSEQWLIYGREKAKYVVPAKTALLLFSAVKLIFKAF